MNAFTSRFTHFSLLSKANWVRFNRCLAWAMVVTPVVQFFLQKNHFLAILAGFGFFVAHGILSLMLFGLPKVKHKNFIFSMHVMGFRPHPLSPRHDFLLTGYRLALANFAGWLLLVPDVRWLALLFLYPLLTMPFSFVRHLKGAINYALKRWGLKDRYSGLIVTAYIIFSVINLRHL
ncbi:hypothetical protein ACO0LG_25335 [Undibacterium sp. Ji42W]|uniref:hypothetical protein n=1 Tax=Undibacterium sp. Ji42W TaxID=3413039 RepID=UPI003BF2992F